MKGSQLNHGFVLDEGVANDERKKSNVFVVDLNDTTKAKEKTEEYDPYLHRNVEHPTTITDTVLHLLKGSLGTGILAMPNAFSHSGYIFGLVATIVIGFTSTYCIHLLIRAEQQLCKRLRVPCMTYTATAETALREGPVPLRKLAPYAVHVVNAFVLVFQLGTCCVYVVFISSNVKSVLDVHDIDIDIKIYMVIFLLPLVLINYIRNLKYLAPFSTVANVVTAVSYSIILYYVIKDGPTLEDREPVGNVKEFPLFVGTVMFALEAIAVVMPLKNEMKKPRAFGGMCGVLNCVMVIITALFAGVGLLGYMAYGDEAKGSITLNIPKEQILAQVVKILLVLSIFVSYGLQCYVAVDITWNEYLSGKFKQRRLLWEYCTRTCLVLITFFLAVAVPNLELFISLFGALCLSALGLAFPAILDSLTNWYSCSGTTFVVMMFRNSALVLFGLFGLVAGTYTSLHDIVETFQ